MSRPAIAKRLVWDHPRLPGFYIHACWQHVHRLEDDTFDVPGAKTVEGRDTEDLGEGDAGAECAFCED